MPWYVKASGGYTRTSTEALENAKMIYGVLYARGWTLNAVSGMLGNVEIESGYNPWRWQSDRIGESTGSPWTGKGYGLTQFTPASKYIDSPYAKPLQGYGPNFSDKTGNAGEGNAQCIFLDEHADYYATASYPLSYSEYKKSTQTASYLARAWVYNYERPGDPTASIELRQESAEFWYITLGGITPPTPGGVFKKMPIWMMLKKR